MPRDERSSEQVVPGRRAGWRAVAAGGGVGLLIWLVDYRFFLNPAGPPAPISRWILHLARLDGASAFVWVLVPAAALVVAGCGVGWLVLYVSRLARRRKEGP